MENKVLEGAMSAAWDIAGRLRESGGEDVRISASELIRIVEGQQELCRMILSFSETVSAARAAHASDESKLLAFLRSHKDVLMNLLEGKQ